jgi:hypothetical protein
MHDGLHLVKNSEKKRGCLGKAEPFYQAGFVIGGKLETLLTQLFAFFNCM